MEENILVAGIAHVIQLAVTPIFLLTGIAGFLNVLSGRLGRITDRVRVVETRINAKPGSEVSDELIKESQLIWRRISLINSAIRLCTSSALLICLVVAVIFVGYYTTIDLSPVISLLFIGSMMILLIGLLSFLREVHLATKTMRSGIQVIAQELDV